jgi:DNA (cytosine-5)-methyltransferase 1
MFKVVDLFAGPGGLAEGFSAVRDAGGRRVFDLALSVEKDPAAFRTLRLRSFVRQFGGELPAAYYEYLAGSLTHEELIAAHASEWEAACRETLQLELGSEGSDAIVDPLLDELRRSGETVLVGGPPCQAYSTVGRARNKGIVGYVPSDDHRHFLYREYIRILARLRPAAFVMENVKGFLSARIEGQSIFKMVVEDLRSAGGDPNSYEILPLTAGVGSGGRQFLIEAERYGVPQARHRVILFGVRRDIASVLSALSPADHRLEPQPGSSVADVLSGMPRLRSRLSRTADTAETWQDAAAEAFRSAAAACFDEEDEELDKLSSELLRFATALQRAPEVPPPSSRAPASVRSNRLADWLIDPNLQLLTNHESRSHMEGDLARYAFASVFAACRGRSPKAAEFPTALAPNHQNWTSGIFNDRFRVQTWDGPSSTVTSHIAKDGHYFIHPDPLQCRSLTVREAARLQTFPDNYMFEGNRTEQYTQVGNAVPPLLAFQIAQVVHRIIAR